MKTELMYCRYSSNKTHRHEDCVDVLIPSANVHTEVRQMVVVCKAKG